MKVGKQGFIVCYDKILFLQKLTPGIQEEELIIPTIDIKAKVSVRQISWMRFL